MPVQRAPSGRAHGRDVRPRRRPDAAAHSRPVPQGGAAATL